MPFTFQNIIKKFQDNKGYSFLIRPLQMLLDSCIIISFLELFNFTVQNSLFKVLFFVFWNISAGFSGFYAVYRFTSIEKIVNLIFKQAFLLVVIIFFYFGSFGEKLLNVSQTLLLVGSIILSIGLFKFGVFFLLKFYRKTLGGNHRTVIILGQSAKTTTLMKYFTSHPDLGYVIKGVFTVNSNQDLEKGIAFIQNTYCDELYLDTSNITENQVNDIMNYCNLQHTVVKLIADTKNLPLNLFHTDYYHYLPIVSIPKMKLHRPINIVLKRSFDIIFSVVVILGVLSWLLPVLYVLIKLDSKGPLFYKHKRNGLNYKEFSCYKLRSLRVESDHDQMHVSLTDSRVTTIGRFLRKTSIDELPQFINVLKGEMSVVGPRPHIPRYTKAYSDKIDKYQYIFRHSVRPGITGLAQIKGYRGEITSDADIINRIRFDIFYIQNWSLIKDFMIILKTVYWVFKGQDKAY